MSRAVFDWFDGWIARHVRWNCGPGWNRYAADEDVFLPWMEAFGGYHVTEEEAVAASKRMAAEEPRYPEHHLHRLLTLIRIGRGCASPVRPTSGSPHTAESDRRTQVSAIVEAAWSRLDDPAREHYRQQVLAASPALGRHRPYVEALAQQAHIESLRPELRAIGTDGQPEGVLDNLRRTTARPDPVSHRRSLVVPTPAVLTREQERIATEQAAESLRDQLERFRAIHQLRPARPDPRSTVRDHRSNHADAV